MGYIGTYSLGARVATEFLGTALVIFLGESVVANAELPRTKGHGMSFGWVAAGFGVAFAMALAIFSRISAHLNPATLIALWVLGELSAGDFFALAAAEFVGAFVGALLVWLHFLPHFRTLPTPPPRRPEAAALLSPGDVQSRNSRQLASYNVQLRQVTPGRGAKAVLLAGLGDLRFYTTSDSELSPGRRAAVEQAALGRSSLVDVEGGLRRRSIQVCDAHKRLAGEDLHDHLEDLRRTRDSLTAQEPNTAKEQREAEALHAFKVAAADGGGNSHGSAQQHGVAGASAKQIETELFEAAAALDRAVKLTVFATRPAVRAPLLNWAVEFLGTTALVSCALLLGLQGELLTPDLAVLWQPFEAAFVGFLVFLLVAGLGGPTGIAMNPARDLGPRLAHWLLPIPGKGSSEWSYALVPATADLVGGLAGGGLFAAIRLLFHSAG